MQNLETDNEIKSRILTRLTGAFFVLEGKAYFIYGIIKRKESKTLERTGDL